MSTKNNLKKRVQWLKRTPMFLLALYLVLTNFIISGEKEVKRILLAFILATSIIILTFILRIKDSDEISSKKYLPIQIGIAATFLIFLFFQIRVMIT